MRRLIVLFALLLAGTAQAQYPSPTFQNLAVNGAATFQSTVTAQGALGTITTGTPAFVGDNTPFYYFQAGRFTGLKQLLATSSNNPLISLQTNNQVVFPQYSNSIYYPAYAMETNLTGLVGGEASLTAMSTSLNLYGQSAYDAQNIGYLTIVNNYGHDSAWGANFQVKNLSGEPPQSFEAIGNEYDDQGNGADEATAQYDPLHAYRRFLFLVPQQASWPAWAATTAYVKQSTATGSSTAGSIVQMNNPSAVLSIYKQTGAATCTSGSSQPTFPASGTVTDGTCTWTYEQPAAYEVGNGIWLDNYSCSTCYYGSGFATDGAFTDAPIDLSEASLLTSVNSTAAGIRLAANMPIDFTGNGTQAGQNLHDLVYSSFYGQLAYVVSGNGTVFAVFDSGRTVSNGYAEMAIGAAGELTGVSSLPSNGATIGWAYSGGNETDIMTTAGGLKLYPVVSGVPAGTGAYILSVDGSGNMIVEGTSTLSGGLVGVTTNSNATAGNVGQFVSSNVAIGSAVSLTTATPATVTSISLTAGDWDVRGTCGFAEAGTTTSTLQSCGINTTAATMPTSPGAGAYALQGGSGVTGTGSVFPAGTTRLSLSGTTTVYLVAQATFAVSTNGAYGFIGARRVR